MRRRLLCVTCTYAAESGSSKERLIMLTQTPDADAKHGFFKRAADLLRKLLAKGEIRGSIAAKDGAEEVPCHELKKTLAALEELWNPKPAPSFIAPAAAAPLPRPGDHRFSSHEQGKSRWRDLSPISSPEPKRPPPWHIGMTPKFTKAVSKVDRKLQGRILEALTTITEAPTTTHGDTIKPLSGGFQGCWRYRIGDFRLIYSPNQTSGNIMILDFANRGAVYGD